MTSRSCLPGWKPEPATGQCRPGTDRLARCGVPAGVTILADDRSAGMTDLAGRTFLVTGANAGIGYATAQELARRGGRVYLGSRSKEKGEQAIDTIRAAT